MTKEFDSHSNEWVTYHDILDHGFIRFIWKHTFCKLGVHLFDECHVLTEESRWEHYIYCDACDKRVFIIS
jgi:hypothetical protein